MKQFYFILCFLFSLSLNAQKWCPAGAEWTYGWGSWGIIGYERIIFDKDTVFMGKICKKLLGNGVNYSGGLPAPVYFDYPEPIYTYSQNDTVFIYYNEAFRPTYFFNAKPGDTLSFGTLDCPMFPDLLQIVDSVGTVIINNDTLRFYTTKFIISQNMLLSKANTLIIEKFGAVNNYLIPDYFCHTDGQGWDLCSYKDEEIYWHNNWNKDTCWYITNTRNQFEQSIIISPNPVYENLQIITSNNDQLESISIINIKGQVVFKLKPEGNDLNNIDISSLDNGLYIINLSSKTGYPYSKKFIKQSY